MRFYTNQHKYYCGIDLHAKNLYVCIVDQQAQILVHKNIPAHPDYLIHLIKPYLDDMALAVECMFTWYWVSDFCLKYNITFILGHALYMKAIHGSKTKNDKIDSQKIAMLLRGGLIPIAYVYPQAMRATRDLLRRRMYFMHKRSELLAHIQNTRSQYLVEAFDGPVARKRHRHNIVEKFHEQAVAKTIEADLKVLNHYDSVINDVENYLQRSVKEHDYNTFYLLRSIYGVGKILALVMLYEIHDITRFEKVQYFTSYARLVQPQKESAGKIKGGANKKMGNAYLKWAFGEAVLLLIREREEVKQLHMKLKNKHGKKVALAILAHKLGRAVYYMLTQHKVFDVNKYVN
jgi:transposase